MSGIENHAKFGRSWPCGPAVHVKDERAWPLVAELGGRQVQPRGSPQAVVRVERRILPGRQQSRVDAERLLVRLLLGRAVRVEHEELRRRCRRAEREGPAAALGVAVDAVQDTACELAFTHEHAAQRERARGLVELGLVGPRDAVDVEHGEVLVAVDALEPLQLAGALVHRARELDRLYVPTPVQWEIAGAVGVVEEARADEEPLLALRDVRGLEAEQRVLGAFLSILQERAPEHRLLARARIALVENDVAGRVAVAEHGARVIARPRDGVGAVHAFAERLHLAGREIDAQTGDLRLLARLRRGVSRRSLAVHVDKVRPPAAEGLLVQRLREASVERNDVGLVVLVTVLVEHEHDAVVIREGVERVAAEQLRVLERDSGRKQRLGHAAPHVHPVQAEPAGKVRDEVELVAGELRVEK